MAQPQDILTPAAFTANIVVIQKVGEYTHQHGKPMSEIGGIKINKHNLDMNSIASAASSVWQEGKESRVSK